MRKFKYVGTQREAEGYSVPIPVIGSVYNENYITGGKSVVHYAKWHADLKIRKEWEEIFEPIRKFKYVGTQLQADCFVKNTPVIGKIYNEDDVISERTALYYAVNINPNISKEWMEVFYNTKNINILSFEDQVNSVLSNIKSLLLSKNEKY